MEEITAVLKIENLTKVFHLGRKKDVSAVNSLSLEIKEREIFGLLGPNGSGKTTTLKLLLGLIFPTSGQIKIFGKDSADITVKRFLGYLPENPYYYRYLTGAELLNFYGQIFELRPDVLKEKREDLLKLVGLAKVRRLTLKHYSKGMLERIGLAVALLNDPKFLILDEPTTGLDPIGNRETRDLILKLQAEGKTILLSSHYLSEVERVCNRIGIMHQGRLLACGRLPELITSWQAEDIEDLFVKVTQCSNPT